ncbi:MAG: hypothetical protein R3250_00485, partial [Melioribacteraceae bacterium]|nr:hypothetical protein [Melioribacteraceae bacterium]
KYFKHRELIKLGIENENERNQYLNSYNAIGNLQLIQETENLEKSATPFVEWLSSNYKEDDLINYKNMHFIPLNNDLTMNDFMEFYESRRETLKSKLLHVLNVSDKQAVIEDELDIIEEELL